MSSFEKAMKFSNSSLDKFRMCGRMYELHYSKRIRPTSISSPLFFGSAVDQALNVLLLKKKKVLDAEEQELVSRDVLEVFDEALTYITYNGQTIDLRRYPEVEYARNDYDERLLKPEDLISTIDRNWLCLRRRGHLLLKEYEKAIMSRILEVISIQRRTSLTNADGDSYEGIIDFIAKWEDGKIYIFDNKTASRKYPDDSVKKSTQLMTYSEDVGINLAGYIVMLKTIGWDKHNHCPKCGFSAISRQSKCPNKCGDLDSKYEPKPMIQVVLDSIDEDNKDKMFSDIQYLADKIKAGEFEPNTNTCHNVFGKKCIYFDYCRTGDMKGLVKIEKV